MRWGIVLVLLLGLWTNAMARNTHGPEVNESQAWWGDMTQAYVTEGCWHGLSASTSVALPSCHAYALELTPMPHLVYFEELASRTITYSAGDGTYWLGGRANPGVTPAGWTGIAGTHYLWIKSATRPAVAPGVRLLGETSVLGGAITAFTIQAAWKRSTPYSVPAGTTLTFGVCPQAGLEHIFNADGVSTGLVRLAALSTCQAVYAEWWGAVGDGVTQSQAFFQSASTALEQSGGTILGAGAGAHYKFDRPWMILASNVTFDGQDALFSGAPASGQLFPVIRVDENCGQECSGETSQYRRNVHLRNYRVGIDATFPQDQMRGGVLHGCENCSITNVRVKTSRGTVFTLSRCNNCLLRDIYIEHGAAVAGGFATLLVHTNNSTVENWYARGASPTTGACCFLFQVKGGVGNRVRNVTIEDMYNPAVDVGDHAFFGRGDAPWKDSETDPVAEPYPFLTNPNAPLGQQDCKLFNCYLFPDSRRASIDTQWTNIAVRRTPGMNCMTIQESVGDTVQGFYAEDCRIGFQVNQSVSSGAGERNFILDNFQIKRISVHVGGPVNGDGFTGVNINGAGTTSLDGREVAVAGFRNMRISNGLVQTTAGQGVLISEASDVTMTNVTVLNAAQKGTVDRNGVQVSGASADIKLLGNRVDDTQAIPTITTGFRVGEVVLQPTLIGNSVVCTACVFETFNYYRALPVGRYRDNTPAFCTARTTDNTPNPQRCVILTKAGDLFQITSRCTARQGTTNRAVYERTAIVEDTAGVITIYPNTGTGDITFESNTNWEVSYASLLEELRIRPQGDTGQTVDWFCDVELINMIP